MDDLLFIHRLCAWDLITVDRMFCGELPQIWKMEDDTGCKAKDAHGLLADFVQEFNCLGRNNPMFYAAYLIGTFCRMAPFAQKNFSCALVLCNFYLVSRDMPPILFEKSEMEKLDTAIRLYQEQEDISVLNCELSTIAAETFSVFCADTKGSSSM